MADGKALPHDYAIDRRPDGRSNSPVLRRGQGEAAKTAQVIPAFEQLAQRLEARVEARRPWRRRLVSG
jgi:hypothetical protein